jgi:hypothetical protein
MINLNQLKAGRRVTFVLAHDCDAMNAKMRKGGRGDNVGNPLWGRVSRVQHIAGNVAGVDTYANVLDKRTGEAPVGARPIWQETETPCVLSLISDASRRCVPIVNGTVQRVELYVDGQPATEAQTALFAEWKKASSSPNPTGYMVLGVDALANVEE